CDCFSTTSSCFCTLPFSNDPRRSDNYTLSLHDALPISHTDGYVLYDWHTVLFPALQCKNDVALDIHNWVRLKFYTQIYTQLLRRSEEHTCELQSRFDLVCRLLLENKISINKSS